MQMLTLNRTCDFCHKRKRRCDGLAQRHCSFCAAKNQAECHYRPRQTPARTLATSTVRLASSSSTRNAEYGDDTARARPMPPLTGRSFWRTDSDAAAAAAAAAAVSGELGLGEELPDSASSGTGGGLVQGPLLPLKRGRFSASPATGLVGLQENEFLGDFFGCLGFLALANQSTVRDAMVRIMLAGGSPQYPHLQHHDGAPSSFQPSLIRCQGREADEPGLVAEDCGDTRQTAFGEISTNVDGSSWNNALVAETGTQVLPLDSSTCILWCAIALGALVRGHPLAQVGRYADLAEDSLRVCRDDATLDTARAYIATAVLHDFLGHPMKTHEYLEVANNIVDGLPPGKIPRGFHGLLQYAGMAWTLDTELASVEDVRSYWENAAPIWELSESVVERDVCSLVLSVCVRMNHHFVDATGVNRVIFAEEPQPQLSPLQPLLSHPLIETAGHQDAELPVEGSTNVSSPKVASLEIPKTVLPEMLRVKECMESSKMDLGVGGLLYYGGLTYLQALNDEETTTSFMRAVDVMLRYPGLCRYKSWLWLAHSHLFILAFTQRRCKYEEMRASYNSVRPPGSFPVPPFEEFRGISDICDHAYCRRSAERVVSVLRAKLAKLAKSSTP